MMEGQLKNRDGKLYVVYSTTEYGRPIRVNLWWRVVQSVGNQYNANRPSAGDTATSRGGGQWSTHGSSGPSGGVSTGTGSTQAEFREEVEVPPPASRGKELRWKDGRWEKLMASGWVPAGEGKAKASAPRHATKKTPAQLQREIDEALARSDTSAPRMVMSKGRLVPPHGYLTDYKTGEQLRPATADEERRSRAAAKRDGGRGVIKIDGLSAYVS